jgi:hypothetical protein
MYNNLLQNKCSSSKWKEVKWSEVKWVFIVHTFASFGSSTNILLLLWWCVCVLSCLVAREL